MTLRSVLVAVSIVAAIVLTSLGTQGQNPAIAGDLELQSLDQKIKEFFLKCSEDDEVQTAYRELLAGSPLSKQTSAMANLEQKTKELPGKYGPRRNVEQVSAKRIGRDLVLMKYLYNCENFPVVWYFTYYRVYNRVDVPRENAWTVIGVRFDTDLELLALGE